ncbi:MAG: hypothetical protein AAGM22_23165 [Acidobacteriota bacterium]
MRLWLGPPPSERLDSSWQWRLEAASPHLDATGTPLVRVESGASARSQDPRAGLDTGWRRFSYHDGALFHVAADARDVWLEWPSALSLESAWPYFAGPVLTWILRRRHRVVLHASAIEVGDGAVLLAGPSGAGKSTTAAAFALSGYAILSDDTSALSRRGGEILVASGGPQLRLWPDASGALAGFATEDLPPICEGWDKRSLAVERFCAEARSVRAVYCLRPEADAGDGQSRAPKSGSKPELLPRSQALPTLVAHAAAPELSTRSMRRCEFELLADLVTRVPVFLLPRGDLQAAGLVDQVLSSLPEPGGV